MRIKKSVRLLVGITIVTLIYFPIMIGFLGALSPNRDLASGINKAPEFNEISQTIIDRFNSIDSENTMFRSSIYTLIVSLAVSTSVAFLSSILGFYLNRFYSSLEHIIGILVLVFYGIPQFIIIGIIDGISVFVNFENTRSASYITTQIYVSHVLYLTPLALWLMFNFTKFVPLSFDREAELDGASSFVFYYKIVFNYTLPLICCVGLLCFSISWNDVIFSNLLSKTDETRFLGDILIENIYRSPEAKSKYGDVAFIGLGMFIISSTVSAIVIREFYKRITTS